jgi:hypothetical protein
MYTNQREVFKAAANAVRQAGSEKLVAGRMFDITKGCFCASALLLIQNDGPAKKAFEGLQLLKEAAFLDEDQLDIIQTEMDSMFYDWMHEAGVAYRLVSVFDSLYMNCDGDAEKIAQKLETWHDTKPEVLEIA